MGGRTGWWTRDISDRPSDAVESSWSDIVEATPDPQGKFWVSTSTAEKLLARVQSAGLRADPALLAALVQASRSGASPLEPGQP